MHFFSTRQYSFQILSDLVVVGIACSYDNAAIGSLMSKGFSPGSNWVILSLFLVLGLIFYNHDIHKHWIFFSTKWVTLYPNCLIVYPRKILFLNLWSHLYLSWEWMWAAQQIQALISISHGVIWGSAMLGLFCEERIVEFNNLESK